VIASGSVVITPDGKSRIASATVTDPSGAKVSSTFVYDKEER